MKILFPPVGFGKKNLMLYQIETSCKKIIYVCECMEL